MLLDGFRLDLTPLPSVNMPGSRINTKMETLKLAECAGTHGIDMTPSPCFVCLSFLDVVISCLQQSVDKLVVVKECCQQTLAKTCQAE